MSTNDYCIAIILYKPHDDVWKRIQAAVDNGHQVFLFDNSPERTQLPETISNLPLVRYMTQGYNAGIGEALSTLCRTALSCGYEQLLYFDQDTIFNVQTMHFIQNISTEILSKPGVGKYYSGKRLASITFRDRKSVTALRTLRVGDVSLQIVKFTINSGSLFDLQILQSIEWHDPGFFIDGVDYAYCLAATRAGYLIGEIAGTPGLNHSFEQDDSAYRFLGLQFNGRRYPRNRRKDFNRASLRLVIMAIRYNTNRTLWLLRSLAVYWIIQTIIPFSKKSND